MAYFSVNQSVSHGTMRNVDLLQSFASALEAASEADGYKHVRHSCLIEDAYNYADDETDLDPDSEEASDIVNELFDALNWHAPDGTMFGSHEGDGSDYGFWQYNDDEACNDEEQDA